MANSLLVGIQAYWKFDESSGNAADSTANGNTLTNNNTGTYSTGALNNAFYLAKASSQYLSITNASITGLKFTGDFSFNGWVYITNAIGGGDRYPIYNKFTTAGQHSYMLRYRNTPDLFFDITSDGTTDSFGSVSWSPSTATWYMITSVYSASAGTCKIYVNGTQQGSTITGLVTSVFDGTSPLTIGDDAGGDPTANWDGRFDEFGFWSKALTGTDITTLYNSGTPLSYTSFDSGASTVVHRLASTGVGA